MNCVETIQDRPGQPAYEMFDIKRRFQRVFLIFSYIYTSLFMNHQDWIDNKYIHT